MKQAAILYAMGNIGTRLAQVRKRTWIMIGLGLFGFMALLAWAAIALLMWLWGQVPVAAESGRQLAGNAMEKAAQVVPALKTQLEPWLGGNAEEAALQAKAGDWPSRDVSGAELPGVARFPGLVRTHYVREARRVEMRYSGQGDFQAVLDHYASQFKTAGYLQEVISANPESEKHRFVKSSDAVDFEIRRAGTGGKIEVFLVDVIS